MTDVTKYILEFVLNVAAFLLTLRFLLQLMRADFYNPISQAIVKVTDPILKPLRLVLPGYKNVDFAALLAMFVVMVLLHLAGSSIGGGYAGTWGQIALLSLYETVLLVIQIIRWSIIINIIASFVAQGSAHPALLLVQDLIEPVLAPLRRLIPAMGGLDFSPLLAFLILGVVEIILPQLISPLL